LLRNPNTEPILGSLENALESLPEQKKDALLAIALKFLDLRKDPIVDDVHNVLPTELQRTRTM
jgi:hypothetical protein